MTQQEPKAGTSDRQDLDTVIAGYRRWNEGDFSGLSELFTENIVYQNAPEWPGQRVYEGVTDVSSFLEDEVAGIIALSPVQIIKATPVGGELLIELQATTRGLLSGVDFADATLFHLATVEAGRVSRVRVYLDEAQARSAAEAGEDEDVSLYTS